MTFDVVVKNSQHYAGQALTIVLAVFIPTFPLGTLNHRMVNTILKYEVLDLHVNTMGSEPVPTPLTPTPGNVNSTPGTAILLVKFFSLRYHTGLF